MSASASSGRHEPHLNEICRVSQQRRVKRRVALLCLCVILILLGSLLTACGTQVPMPCEAQPPTLKPVAVSPPPTISFSLKAETLFKKWQAMLDDAISNGRH